MFVPPLVGGLKRKKTSKPGPRYHRGLGNPPPLIHSVNVDRPLDWRVMMTSEEEEEESKNDKTRLFMAIGIPWAAIYALLLANAIYGQKKMARVMNMHE